MPRPRRRHARRGAALALDPVCGREVAARDVDALGGRLPGGARERPSGAGVKRYLGGRWHYFCSIRCRLAFMATSDAYLGGGDDSP